MGDRPRPSAPVVGPAFERSGDPAAGRSDRPPGLASHAPDSRGPGRVLTRRGLLKGLGFGALAVGGSALLEACSTSATAVPATVAPSPAGGSALPSAGEAASPSAIPSVAATPAASAGKIVIGFVTPQTGPLAGFASGDQFIVDRIRATDAYKNGMQVGGKRYDVEIVVRDTQSDPNRASQVAQDLVLQQKADLVLTTSTPETTNPVAQYCETQGVPCLSTVVPWQAWFFGRQADPAKPVPFKYTTMFFFGAETFGSLFVPMWNRIPSNKVVGGMFPNDADGNAFRAVWPDVITKAGYTWVDGGAYPDGTTDFTAMISTFKEKQAEIFINAPLPPDFNTFWKQAAQQGYKPKLATVAKVLLFPADTEALGDLVNNIATDSWWGPFMPYKSSLTGESSKDLADAYQAASGKQWLQTLGSTYSLFEVAELALLAVDDPHDHGGLATELGKVSYSGICGPLDFTKGPQPGIGMLRPVGVQWQKGKTYPWEMVVVDNTLNPDVKVSGDLNPTNPDLVAALLELEHVTKRFGRVVVADDLSISIGAGDAVGIVGPNGAGKTSLFGIVSGDLSPESGVVRLDGRPVNRLDAAARCRLGVGRTYQVPRPFEGMTVFENVLVAAQQGARTHGQASFEAAAAILDEIGLAPQANCPAGQLGLLARKRLELGRALATRPRLLLLDEVAGGLTDLEVRQVVDLVVAARARGVAVVWIEHVVRALVSVVDRLVCLAGGRIIGDGTPRDVLADPGVKEVFLGTEATAESLVEAAAVAGPVA